MPLGITTIQRDRAPWIKEWLAFHYLVGFRKFYIYLHQCSDDTEKITRHLKKKFDINLLKCKPGLEAPQLWCYQDSYTKFGDGVDWMAFIDSDEFLFPTHADTLDVPLAEFTDKPISALGVYWSCFGSSGYTGEPKGLIIENYRYRASDGYHNNRHIKSLIRGGQSKAVVAYDPHIFRTQLGTFDENLKPVTKGWTDYEPTYQKFRINHYVTQSRSYFLNFRSKIRTPDGGVIRDEGWWKEHDRNDILDNSMDKFIEPLKNILKSI